MLWAIFGPPWASEKGLRWSNMAYNHVIYPWEVFWGHLGSYRAIWGHKWPNLVIKGYFGVVLGHYGAPLGLRKGPKVVQHDKISCGIPMGSVLGPFGLGSCKDIWGHEEPFW